MIKISVIIPIYNMEEYLPQCLDSIVSQTLREIEILCIDDGSTDGSEEVLKLYCNRDSRIRVIKQNNQGVLCARNLGIEEHPGKYVIFMDPDDWYPDKEILETHFMWELRKIMSALQVEVLWTITMEFIMKNP